MQTAPRKWTSEIRITVMHMSLSGSCMFSCLKINIPEFFCWYSRHFNIFWMIELWKFRNKFYELCSPCFYVLYMKRHVHTALRCKMSFYDVHVYSYTQNKRCLQSCLLLQGANKKFTQTNKSNTYWDPNDCWGLVGGVQVPPVLPAIR